MNDLPALMHQLLLTKPPLTALIGAQGAPRLWAERAEPPTGYRPSQGYAIAFLLRGGLIDYSSVLMDSSWQFKCYGVDEVEAQRLYRTLFAAINDKPAYHFRSLSVGFPRTMYEQDKGWPYVLTFVSSQAVIQEVS